MTSIPAETLSPAASPLVAHVVAHLRARLAHPLSKMLRAVHPCTAAYAFLTITWSEQGCTPVNYSRLAGRISNSYGLVRWYPPVLLKVDRGAVSIGAL